MKDLPTSTTRPPKISPERQAELLAHLSAAVELTPLNAPVMVATAYMEGVPITALAKWFGVPRQFMLDFVNVHLIGNAEVTRLKRAGRAKASAMKAADDGTEAVIRRPLSDDARAEAMRRHPSNGKRPTE